MTHDLPFPGHSGSIESWFFSLFFFVLCFFLIGLIARRFFFDFRSKRIIITVCLSMSIGALLYSVFDAQSSSFNTTLFMLSLFLIGILTPIPYIETVRQFMRSGFKMMLICGAVATFLTNIGFFILLFSPAPVVAIVTMLIPLGLCACLLASNRGSKPHPIPEPAMQGRARTPYKLLMTSIVQGSAYGLGRLCLTRLDSFTVTPIELTILVQMAGFVLSALTLVVLVSVFKFDFNLLIYKIGFIMLGLGLLFLTMGPLNFLGLLSFAAGYRFIDLLIFTLVVYLSSAKNISLNWTASWPTCMLYIGFAIGYLLLGGLIDIQDWLTVDSIVALMAMIVLLLAIILVSERNVPGAWGYVKLTDEESSSNPYREQVVNGISRHGHLSDRQHEIFELIAKGKFRREIAQELHLSEETVKVHIRNIYKKLGVHSKSELNQLIESEEKLLVE